MAGKKTGSKKQTNVVKRKENKNKQTWLKKTTTKTNKRGRKKQNKNKQMWSEKKRGRKKKTWPLSTATPVICPPPYKDITA